MGSVAQILRDVFLLPLAFLFLLFLRPRSPHLSAVALAPAAAQIDRCLAARPHIADGCGLTTDVRRRWRHVDGYSQCSVGIDPTVFQ